MIQNLNLEESQGTEQFVNGMEMVLLTNNGAHQNIGEPQKWHDHKIGVKNGKAKETTIVVS